MIDDTVLFANAKAVKEVLYHNMLEGMELQVAANRTFAEAALDAAVTRDGRLRTLKLLGLHRWRTLDGFLAVVKFEAAQQKRRAWRAGRRPQP
ncbi:cyclopropane-fatty-acyl-phospholipid synthase [Chlorella sorokiniana]|uniref:Cyclopropane-fatty-acyl-phospholipid synthase n=1 Tax=Chlorella sorokiniana TaxID=3076 RepID=A0A2P6TI83_CHLSO|nr:cyclopropane-fatty-acyl-phospholipid synthase [Chlorella sorokiniana]|eukprot:PRW33987.1 cyclopropane-fatty-acyl-phospholipid synthase [Chlorella sorokiniana]